MEELLTTNKNEHRFLVIDCRYEYEYQGKKKFIFIFSEIYEIFFH